MNETDLQITQRPRLVVLDIETVTLDKNVPKGALDALTGRVVCVGLLMDDGAQLSELAMADEDEAQILTKFWSAIHPSDTLVGFNLIEFDLPFIKKRSWLCNVRPTRSLDLRRYYSTHVDVMQLWTNWSFRKFVSLDTLSVALNCGQKSAHGEDVAEMWATGDLDRIKQYCVQDVWITYRMYCRLTYQEPRTSKMRPKANAAEILAERIGPVRPNKRQFRRDSDSLPIQTLAHDLRNLDGGSLALTARQRRR
jgi:predicted PolB exonuclease-like 3'-5' exonuclease